MSMSRSWDDSFGPRSNDSSRECLSNQVSPPATCWRPMCSKLRTILCKTCNHGSYIIPFNTKSAGKLSYKPWRSKVFSILNHYICLFDSFKYLCYGPTTIENISTLTARGSNLDVRIWSLMSTPGCMGKPPSYLIEFSSIWSCAPLTRSTTSSEWKLFRFKKMEVNYFEILLIDVYNCSKAGI